MNKKAHLPVFGVGPFYVISIVILTVSGIILGILGLIPTATIKKLEIPFIILGIILIVLCIVIWIKAVFQSKIDERFRKNTLVTDGIYAWVRHPIYSAFLLICTGVLFIARNLWLLILPFFFWLLLTILMIHTEEKWLEERFGLAYRDYCKQVNRCIPWFPRKYNKQ